MCCYCCCNVTLKRIYFWLFSTEWRWERVHKKRETQQYEKWRNKNMGTSCYLWKCFVVWQYRTNFIKCMCARLIFISDMSIQCICRCIWCWVFFCTAYFFCVLSCHSTPFKNKLPVFSAIYIHTLAVLCFYCVGMFTKWYFRNEMFEISWAQTIRNVHTRVHIEHFTNSMWLNWMEYSYFSRTHCISIFVFTSWATHMDSIYGHKHVCFIEFYTIHT